MSTIATSQEFIEASALLDAGVALGIGWVLCGVASVCVAISMWRHSRLLGDRTWRRHPGSA